MLLEFSPSPSMSSLLPCCHQNSRPRLLWKFRFSNPELLGRLNKYSPFIYLYHISAFTPFDESTRINLPPDLIWNPVPMPSFTLNLPSIHSPRTSKTPRYSNVPPIARSLVSMTVRPKFSKGKHSLLEFDYSRTSPESFV